MDHYDLRKGTYEEKRERARQISTQLDRENTHHRKSGSGGGVLLMFIIAAILLVAFANSAKSVELVKADSITINYAQESIKKFVVEPNSMNLHRVGCALFFGTQMTVPIEPADMFSRYADVGDDFKSQTMLLLNNTIWFTDYVYESPKFSYGTYLFQFNRELPGQSQWQVSDDNGLNTVMTWGEVVCLVMNINYDPAYDFSLIVQREYEPSNSEDNPRFVGPRQNG